jgi:hypothetical protein
LFRPVVLSLEARVRRRSSLPFGVAGGLAGQLNAERMPTCVRRLRQTSVFALLRCLIVRCPRIHAPLVSRCSLAASWFSSSVAIR